MYSLSSDCMFWIFVGDICVGEICLGVGKYLFMDKRKYFLTPKHLTYTNLSYTKLTHAVRASGVHHIKFEPIFLTEITMNFFLEGNLWTEIGRSRSRGLKYLFNCFLVYRRLKLVTVNRVCYLGNQEHKDKDKRPGTALPSHQKSVNVRGKSATGLLALEVFDFSLTVLKQKSLKRYWKVCFILNNSSEYIIDRALWSWWKNTHKTR